MAAKKKRQPPYCVNLEVDQWHERDRNHVHVRTTPGERTVAEWWDEDVHSMVEDGFFKTGRLPRSGVDPQSVLDYLADVGACRRGTPGSIFDGVRRRRKGL